MNTFRYAFRFLSRKKAFTTINILGLALSLACCIVLGRYLYREVTVDRHAIDAETMYMVYRVADVRGHTELDLETLKDYYDNDGSAYIDQLFEDYCSVYTYSHEFVRIFDREQSFKFLVVDSTFVHFFHYEIEGDADALKKEDACWVSDEYIKSCGRAAEDVIGGSVDVLGMTLRIAGVFHKPECQVVYNPDLIIPRHAINSFMTAMPTGLFRVRSDFDAEEVEKKLSSFGEAENHRHFWWDTLLKHEFVSWFDYYFSNKEHESEDSANLRHHGNASLCWILFAVLILILAVGIINFINLYIVYCQRRTLESGVRRVFGRQTRQLFFELWSELVILTVSAVFVAWLLIELTKPWVEQMLGDTNAGTPFDIFVTLGVVVILPLLAAVYPFVQQRRYSPSAIMRQKAGTVQSIKARTVILGFQYFISISLVILSLWMSKHLDFLINSPVGFDADRVLLVRPVYERYTYVRDENGDFFEQSNRDEVLTILTEYTNRLRQSPLVENFCKTSDYYLPFSAHGEDVYYNKKGEECLLKCITVPVSWFDVFGIKLQEGVVPDPEKTLLFQKGGSGGIEGWLANRQAMQRLGYQTLEDAYARRKDPLVITSDGVFGNEEYPILGIVGDHYSGHRTMGASAAVYILDDEEKGLGSGWYDDSYIAIRFRPENKEALYSYIVKLQEEICPNQNLKTRWLSDKVEEQYKSDKVMADVYRLFSAIAVVICCLGLLGLSLFDVRQRYREVAIRKANGAHRKDLYLLLGKKYMYVMLVAFVLSIPVTYLFVHNYTESFIESAPLTPLIYLEALGIILLITILTLVYHLEKAVRVNVASVVKAE
ncbi:MAG: ABC transporter permease [Bacteroidales bacterium]|nr:ABC transporter permease [Bacteroidales bacterium]